MSLETFVDQDFAYTKRQYRAQDKPWYTLGHGIVLMYIGIGFICSVSFLFLLRNENAKRDRGERDEVIVGVNDKQDEANGGVLERKNGKFASVAEAKKEKGDAWSGYRYTT